MLRPVAFWLTVLAAACFASAADNSSPAAKADEIKAQFAAGDYQDVLRESAQLLSLGKKAAEGVDLHAVILLRAESLLRLKQTDAAAQAFHQASKMTDDHAAAAIDLASELVIRRSKQLKYTPKAGATKEKPAPIDITPAEARKQAISALFTDEWAVAAPKIKAAQEGTSLPLIATAVKAIQTQQLAQLEVAAKGTDDQSKHTTEDLRKHAQGLMAKALEKLGKQVQDIVAEANEIVHQQAMVPDGRGGYVPQDIPHRRGLQGAAQADLKSIARLANQIAQAGKELVADLGDKAAADDLAEQAHDIVQRADKALRADYSRV